MGVKSSKLSRFGGLKKHLPCPPAARRVPIRGYIPVSVGIDNGERRVFMVHLRRAFCDEEFLELLCRSAEEYGFCNQGVLRIPCEANTFEQTMILSKKPPIVRT